MGSMTFDELVDKVGDIIASHKWWHHGDDGVYQLDAATEIVNYIIALNNETSVIENLGG